MTDGLDAGRGNYTPALATFLFCRLFTRSSTTARSASVEVSPRLPNSSSAILRKIWRELIGARPYRLRSLTSAGLQFSRECSSGVTLPPVACSRGSWKSAARYSVKNARFLFLIRNCPLSGHMACQRSSVLQRSMATPGRWLGGSFHCQSRPLAGNARGSLFWPMTRLNALGT